MLYESSRKLFTYAVQLIIGIITLYVIIDISMSFHLRNDCSLVTALINYRTCFLYVLAGS
jgi:hypothetical protein